MVRPVTRRVTEDRRRAYADEETGPVSIREWGPTLTVSLATFLWGGPSLDLGQLAATTLVGVVSFFIFRRAHWYLNYRRSADALRLTDEREMRVEAELDAATARDEARKAREEADALRALSARKPRRLDITGVSDPVTRLVDGVAVYPTQFQVYAPYGDDEAATFAEDIARALHIMQWQGRNEVERQLYEGAPAEGIFIWHSREDQPRRVATELMNFFRAMGHTARLAEQDDYSLGLSDVVEIHVRARGQ